MPVVRFYLNDDAYAELEANAKLHNLSIQDYVRSKCISPRENDLTVEMVIKEIRNQKPVGEFRLRDLFDDESWNATSLGVRAYVGKAFFEQVDANKIPEVEFVAMKQRIARYRLK